jgi:hypothetical protein
MSTFHSASFCFNWKHNRRVEPKTKCIRGYPYPYFSDVTSGRRWYGPPGGAWAARKEAIDSVGGIPDIGILGSGDVYMAAALVGELEFYLHKDFSPEYNKHLLIWQERALTTIRKNIGYVDGLVIHYYHGSVKDRGYEDRNDILIRNKFNPETDIKKDWQGLWQLSDHGDDRSIALRDDIRRYFRLRNEDMPSE